MKKLFLFSALAVFSLAGFAQSERYIAAMKKNMAGMDTAFSNPANLLTLSNNFERIATAEKNQWLAWYYAALCQVNFGFMQKDTKAIDGIAYKATELINKADSLQPNNSEISCIKSLIASCHMNVDPMSRWQQYGEEISANMEKAMNEDPNNPRPYYLKGQNLKYTPEQFGGGCKVALAELKTAMDKFAAFKPATELHPTWGKPRVEQLIKECNQ